MLDKKTIYNDESHLKKASCYYGIGKNRIVARLVPAAAVS